MKRLAAALLLGTALVGLTACTETEKHEAVEPVVRHVIESFLEPITVESDGREPMGATERAED